MSLSSDASRSHRGRPGRQCLADAAATTCSRRSTSACRSVRCLGRATVLGRQRLDGPRRLLLLGRHRRQRLGAALHRTRVRPATAGADDQPEENRRRARSAAWCSGRWRWRSADTTCFASPIWMLALLGAAISLLGIVGDLFESLLEAQRRREGLVEPDPRPRRRPRSHRQLAVRRPVYYMFVRFVA